MINSYLYQNEVWEKYLAFQLTFMYFDKPQQLYLEQHKHDELTPFQHCYLLHMHATWTINLKPILRGPGRHLSKYVSVEGNPKLYAPHYVREFNPLLKKEENKDEPITGPFLLNHIKKDVLTESQKLYFPLFIGSDNNSRGNSFDSSCSFTTNKIEFNRCDGPRIFYDLNMGLIMDVSEDLRGIRKFMVHDSYTSTVVLTKCLNVLGQM